jgi:hypothetical protein
MNSDVALFSLKMGLEINNCITGKKERKNKKKVEI